MGVRRFEDLVCWQLTIELAGELEVLTSQAAVAARGWWCDQVNDASSSAARNIAEGFRKRSRKEFARYLDVALASLGEVQSLLAEAVRRGFVPADAANRLRFLAIRAGIATARLAARQREFVEDDERNRKARGRRPDRKRP